MNAVLLAVLVMLILSVCRIHVVLALFIGALVGGLAGGLGLDGTLVAFQTGLSGGAKIAFSYALLGAFAMAVAASGLPKMLADKLISRIGVGGAAAQKTETAIKVVLIGGLLAMSIMSQNVIPVHIAFIPLIVPPLLVVMDKIQLDRRLVACVLTFGLVTTYMFLPVGFGSIFLHEILLANIESAGLDTAGASVMKAMAIPALGMVAGLLLAVFVSYRKPRVYAAASIVDGGEGLPGDPLSESMSKDLQSSSYKVGIAVVAIVATFVVQIWMMNTGFEADSLMVGALVGLAIFLVTGAVKWREADDVFTAGMKMMALIGFIMISAQGFAAVMTETGAIDPLVTATADLFAGNKAAAAFAMLLVGLIVTMGIGSSFSTLPIIAAIYVPLCMALGFSPLATISLIGTAGALGDAGSPASDSTLGPTSGLNADGQHDHIRDSVIPTFLHYNIPLLLAGWVAAMVL